MSTSVYRGMISFQVYLPKSGCSFLLQKGDVAAIAELFPFTNFFANAPQVRMVSSLASKLSYV